MRKRERISRQRAGKLAAKVRREGCQTCGSLVKVVRFDVDGDEFRICVPCADAAEAARPKPRSRPSGSPAKKGEQRVHDYDGLQAAYGSYAFAQQLRLY